jgi:hypothetical protein
MPLCDCSQLAALPAIPVNACPENFGQIQKIIFQRLTSTVSGTTTKNTIASASANLKATWTALFSAVGGTKMVITPYIVSAVAEPGGPLTTGGGNDSVDGIEEINGSEPTAFKCVLKKSPQDTVAALKKLMCESVGVYLVNQFGQIGGIKTTSGSPAVTAYAPIPIRSFFVSDKGFGGLLDPDTNNIQWSFPPNYSDDFAIIKPTDFNPITDLVNVA